MPSGNAGQKCFSQYGKGRGPFSAQEWGIALLVKPGLALEEHSGPVFLKFKLDSNSVEVSVHVRAHAH